MNIIKLCSSFFTPLITTTRGNFAMPRTKGLRKWTGGKKHVGFTYFPRPGEVDPPYEPSKLFMVQRIKPFKGNAYWLKKILTEIGLGEEEKMSKVVIVKNSENMNASLWKIKHIVKITPVKFLNGEPTEKDINYCQINEWGEVTISKELCPEEKLIEETEKFLNNPLHLDAETKKKDTRLRWNNPYNL